MVIPCYGRAQLLVRGLEALTRQTLARSEFEVIAVDDGSPEPIEPVVRRFLARLPLTVLRKPNGGLAAARTFGAARAVNEILLFMDDDIVPGPEFLRRHLEVHESRPRAVALGALPHPTDVTQTPFLYYLERILHYDLFLRFGSIDKIPLPPLNGNSSIRREEFFAIGGYDPHFAGYGGEDTELGYRLLKAGFEFVYAPEAVGVHYHVKDFAAYKRDMHASGVTMVSIVRKHPEVLARVNLDLATPGFIGVAPGKLPRKLAFRALEKLPGLVALLDGVIARTESYGWKRFLYPFYYTVGHYHYGRGMREEMARAPLG